MMRIEESIKACKSTKDPLELIKKDIKALQTRVEELKKKVNQTSVNLAKNESKDKEIDKEKEKLKAKKVSLDENLSIQESTLGNLNQSQISLNQFIKEIKLK
jgi:FtsZ-binding cell division protein ZapB